MPDVLVVMNPRRIPACIDAFQKLPIAKLWIRNMTEWQIMEEWPKVLRLAKGYDRMILCSDDAEVKPRELKKVQQLLDQGHPVVTGYSNLSEHDMRVNLCTQPLGEHGPSIDCYSHPDLHDIAGHTDEAILTSFTGMCLTGMSRAMWRKYPFKACGYPPGWSSDYNLSLRLQQDGVPIVAARDAFVWHHKSVYNMMDPTPGRELLIGKEPAELKLEPLLEKAAA